MNLGQMWRRKLRKSVVEIFLSRKMSNGNEEKVVMVIGIGRIGKVHVGNLLKMQNVRVKYILDVFVEAVERYISEHGLRNTTALHVKDAQVAYNDEEVQAVIVCTPTSSHEEHVKNALNAGKSVMCEKPLAFSLEAIKSCYDIAERNNLLLYCAFNRRFDPTFRSAWMTRETAVGKLKSVKVTSRDSPRTGIEYLKISGGMCIDQCIHDVDIIRWFVQEEPDTVYAVGHAYFDDIRDIGDVDQLYIMLDFPSAMGHVDANREAKYGHDNRIEIFGDKGMITCDNKRALSTQLHTQQGQSSSEIFQNVVERYADAYDEEMRHFLAALRGECVLEISARDVMWVTLICEAAHESLVAKQPIQIKEYAERKYPDLSSFWKKDPLRKLSAA